MKFKKLLLIMFLFFLVLGAQVPDARGDVPQCVQPSSGMVSWWGGDNNALDMVSGNNGTLMGEATYAPGMVGQAFSFDGVDDYVDLPNGFADFTSGFTVGLWANPTVNGSWARFIDLGNGQADNNILFDRRTTSNDLTLEVYDGAGNSTGMAYAENAITNNEWHYYAATLDATGKVKLYKDGLPLVMAADTTGVPNNVTRTSNFIGRSNWSNDAYYAGSIDEVQIFNRVLTAEEIASIYSAGSAGNCKPQCTPPPSGMVSWWTGDDNAQDMQGANHGTLTNGTTFADGKVGRAFSFDGVDDYVSAPASSNWAFGTGDFAVEFWAFGTTNDYKRPLINNRRTPASNSMWAIEIYGVANRVEFHSGLTVYLTATNMLTSSSWNHIAVTRNGSLLSIYINGVLSGSVSNSTDFSEINDLQIGRDIMSGNDLAGRSYQGLIDEVSIFNRSLSAEEIAVLYNAGSAGNCKPQCTTPPSGMVSWWGGDNNALDMVGTNNGTVVNGATYAAGKVGQAFSFDGVNDWIEVTSGVGDLGNNPFTVDFWMKSNNDGSGDPTFILGKNHANGGLGWDIRLSNNTIRVVGVNGWGFNITSDASATPDVWHHIALASTDATVNLYIDGVLKGTSPRSTISATTNPFRIGYTTDFGSPAFNGLIDEVEIFNRALTTDEIAAIYYAGSAGKCRSCVNTPSNMISWWNGEGDANDSIGTNHGAVTNGATFSPGKIGQTFSFDGVDDYITIPHNADLNPSAITVDAWIKTPAGPERVVVEKSHDNTGGWVMEVQPDGRASFGYFNGDASWTTNSVFSIGTVHDNNWHHVAATLEGSAIKIYIDGALDNSAVYSGSPVTNTRDVNIGKWHGGSRFFNGLIDEVGIFSRALTASEIAAIYNAGSAGICSNNSPVANDQSVSTLEDMLKNITLSGTDADGDPLTYTVVSGPSNGALSGTAPNVTYTPDADYNGSDSFTFKVNDGTVNSNIATVMITVDAINDPPTVDAGVDQTGSSEGSTVSLAPATFADSDASDAHTATITWGDGTGTQAGTVNEVSRTVSGSHVYADNGSYVVRVTVWDEYGAQGSDTFVITVSNVAPTVDAGANQTVSSTASLAPATFTDSGTSDTHAATINWGDGTGTQAGTVNEVSHTVSGSHVYADNGSYTVTVTVTDEDGGQGSDTLLVTVDNQAPTTTAAPSGGTFSSAQSVTLSCNDISGSGCVNTYYCTGAGCSPTTAYSGNSLSILSPTILRFNSMDSAGNSELVKEENYAFSYQVTIGRTGPGTGTVTSNISGTEGNGIDCGADCSETYNHGAAVSLTATPAADSYFVKWTGDVSGITNPITVTMSGHRNVTALFATEIGVCATCSIQAAIDAATPGDVIKVQQGTYNENLFINTAKELTISGGWNSSFTTQTADPGLTILSGDTDNDGVGDDSVLSITAGATVIIDNLTIMNGDAPIGGGLNIEPASGLTDISLSNCIISSNSADDGAGIHAMVSGGSIVNLSIQNCLIIGNNAFNSGGGIKASATGTGSTVTVNMANNTLTGNIATPVTGGGGIHATAASSGSVIVTEKNDINWGNTAPTGPDLYSSASGGGTALISAQNSDIGTGIYTDLGGNISADPEFLNTAGHDYRLDAISSCIDSGTVSGAPTQDILGVARPQGAAVDIGAYEFAGTSSAVVKLLALTGGEHIPAGEYYTVRWEQSAAVANIALSYSIDGGVTWKKIKMPKPFTGTSVDWVRKTPKTNLDNMKLKITAYNLSKAVIGEDISYSPFSMYLVWLMYPNGGEQLKSGMVYRVLWDTTTAMKKPPTSAALEYSTDGGVTWIAAGTTTGNPGYYDWTAPVVSTPTAYQARIVLKNLKGKILAIDASDTAFTIVP